MSFYIYISIYIYIYVSFACVYTHMLFLEGDWFCSKMGYVVLQCGRRDKASFCCKKDGDVLVLEFVRRGVLVGLPFMIEVEFVRCGFLVGLLIDNSFLMPLTHCTVSKGGKKTWYLFHALIPCPLIS